jgi:outer membrane protein TolC
MRRLLAAAVLLACALPAAAAPLSMAEAIRRAVDGNVAIRVARAADDQAKARALAAASELLPAVTGTASQQRVYRENLRALGFGGPGSPIPDLIGPFNVFDARFRLAMSVLDVPSWKRWSQARALGRAADAEQALASEQVAGAAALAYIESLRAREAIRAAQAGLELADELVRLAQERKSAGTGMGLDVTRALSRQADEKLRLILARTAATEADLRLERVVGLPLGQPVELAESLTADATAAVSLEQSIASAESGRFELAVARERLSAAGLALSASRAEYLPRLSVNADAGLSGNLPDREARVTGSIGAGLSMPLFDWRVASRAKESRAARDETEARYEDLRLAVEEDVRRAVDRLSESVEGVQTARLGAQLAHREVELARGRFEAGVGDNLELTTAQAQRAQADDVLAVAYAAFHTARVNLALATGRMRDYAF